MLFILRTFSIVQFLVLECCNNSTCLCVRRKQRSVPTPASLRATAMQDVDVEELSARLSLMSPGGSNEQQDASAVAAEGYNTNQCIYLEQLLVIKSVLGALET
uniref:Uncharacterized protein n=1 Tax=Timema bartmani TaxID=61472 RepID=A0A7R9F2D4_9NEOP|nr:unnamed protein product [Timema bartmani]